MTPRNEGYAYRSQIDATTAGATLLDYLSGRWRHSARDEWRARILRGEVQVNGATATADTPLAAGQRVTWHRPAWREPEVPLNFELLLEDDHLIAVSKPSGLPTMAAGGFLAHTLTSIVTRRFPNARPLHRLGRFTSGVVLFARTAEAAATLAAAWRERRVGKRYRALSEGVAADARYDITTRIGRVAYARLGSIYAATASGKEAESVALVLERRADTTLFQVDITTGRPHQIRIHLASIGYPLQADPLYGPGGVPCAGCTALPGDGGYLLHAESLRFPHPADGRLTEVRAMSCAALLRCS